MRKLTHFDGLRGIAAFVVFLAHFRPTFCLNIEHQALDFAGVTGENTRAAILNFSSLLYEGALPVFIFWLMSSYVISVKLFQADRTKSERYLVEASTKRYFRLAIPVLVASFICFFLLRANLIFNIPLAEKLGSGYSDGWLNQQYHFIPGIFHFLRTTFIEVFMNGNCNYNFVLWTMAPELFGSFLCFGLFAVFGNNRLRFVVYIMSSVLLTFGGFRDVTYFFYLTFMIGIMWCDAMNSKDEDVATRAFIKKLFDSRLVTLSMLVLSFGVPLYSDTVRQLPANLYYLFAFPLKAVAITLGVHQWGLMRRLLSARPLRFMGKISFSLYLLHIPVLFSVGAWIYLQDVIPTGLKLPLTFASVLVSLIFVSYLFEKYIDRNSIKIANRIGRYFASKSEVKHIHISTAEMSSQPN